MALGDITFQTLDTDNENYQPSGDLIYRVVWVACGGQNNQAVRMKDTADSNIEVFLYNKDSGQEQFNGFGSGTIQGSFTFQAGINGLYISNQFYLNLSGASDSGNEVIFTLLEVAN